VPLDIVLRGPTHESRRTQSDWRRAFNRTLLVGDVNGDRRSDLLIESEFTELRVFDGVPGTDVIAPQAQRVSLTLPHDGEYTWLVDLNRDGKQDILMHHPFTARDHHGGQTQPPEADPNRVVVLIAR
jgi:hypothetical protein